MTKPRTETEILLFNILRQIRAVYYDSQRKPAAAWQETAQKMFEITNEALVINNLPGNHLFFEEKLDILCSNSATPEAVESAKTMVIAPTPSGGLHMSWAKKSAAIEFGADGEIVSIWWEKPRE